MEAVGVVAASVGLFSSLLALVKASQRNVDDLESIRAEVNNVQNARDRREEMLQLEVQLCTLLDNVSRTCTEAGTKDPENWNKLFQPLEREATVLRKSVNEFCQSIQRSPKRKPSPWHRVLARRSREDRDAILQRAESQLAIAQFLLQNLVRERTLRVEQFNERVKSDIWQDSNLNLASSTLHPTLLLMPDPEHAYDLLGERAYLRRHARYKHDRFPDSCQWFLRCWAFQEWIGSASQGHLWCQGESGIGKSFITSQVIDHLEEMALKEKKEPSHIVESEKVSSTTAYFYFGLGESDRANELLGSVVQQVCIAHAYFPRRICASIGGEQGQTHRTKSQHSYEDLEASFREVVMARCLHGSIRVIVDGLDVQDVDKDEQIANVFELFVWAKCSLLIFSQSAPKSELIATGWDHFQIQARHTDEDIRRFVEIQMALSTSIAEISKKDDEFKTLVVNRIIHGSQGHLFRCFCGTEQIMHSKTPSELFDLAHAKTNGNGGEMVTWALNNLLKQSNENAILAKRTLIWLSTCHQPMEMKALCEALTIAKQQSKSSLSLDEVYTPEIVLNSCKSFRSFVWNDEDSSTVSLANIDIKRQVPKSWKKDMVKEQRALTAACIERLLMKDLESGPSDSLEGLEKRLNDHPFLRYAALNWLQHYCDSFSPELEVLACRLVESPVHLASVAQIVLWSQCDSVCDDAMFTEMYRQCRSMSALQIALHQGLDRLVRRGVYFTHDQHLSEALEKLTTIETLIQGLLESNKSETRGKRAPIESSLGVSFVSKLLFSDATAIDLHRRKFLELAINQDDLEMIERLLQRTLRSNEDNIADWKGWNPLVHAIERNHDPKVIQALLAAGASGGGSEITALQCASLHGQTVIVDLLIQYGAPLDAPKGSKYSSPLLLAKEHGHSEVFRTLLRSGAELD